jgi:hypothetical protein
LLVAAADVTDRLGPGYEGSGGWFENLRMLHRSVTPIQFLDAAVRYGIEHHYAVTPQDVTDALMEAANWLRMHLVEPREVHDHI